MNKYSEEELDKLLMGPQSPPKQKELPTAGSLSEADLDNLLMQDSQKPEDPSLLSQAGSYALEKVGQAGQFVDKYTGAPTRAAIGAAQDYMFNNDPNKKNPLEAAYDQFGEDPSLAPTGKELAQKAGVSDKSLSDLAPGMFTESDAEADKWLKFKKGGAADISASGAAGMGLDVVADPTNVIPGVAIAKGAKVAGKGAKAATKAALNVSGEIGELLAKGTAKTTAKAGSKMTGLPENLISKYISDTDEIEKIIRQTDGDVTLAADELRERIQDGIRGRISALNNEIDRIIKNAPADKVPADPIIEALEKSKGALSPEYHAGAIGEINEMISNVKNSSQKALSKSGYSEASVISAKEANAAKRFLQQRAKSSYLKGGQVFSTSKEGAGAAKQGARAARKIEMDLAPETIAANKELSEIHSLEKNINKNIIAPGKTERALISAGSGANSRNAKNLQDVSKYAGFDALDEAQKLAAAEAFAKPGWVPVDATGKSGTRMAFGALIGSMLAGPAGTAAGIAATSPAVLKMAIKSGKLSKKMVQKLAGGSKVLSDAAIEKAIKAAGTKEGQLIIRSFEKGSKQSGIQNYSKVADNEEPKKGPEKWANDGFNNVIQSASPEKIAKFKAMREELLKSKRGRAILSRAQGVKPNSKAMNAIIRELDKMSEAK